MKQNEFSRMELFSAATIPRDLVGSLVVFLVALPLCLGVALASNAPLQAGLIAGIVGGIVAGILSGSHTSVSGPAAGLTFVVASQISTLGSFRIFLFALMIAGVFQFVLGMVRTGNFATFFPSSVVKGLLTAIGIILVLKQIPHLVGHDLDPEGDMAFWQYDNANSLTELLAIVGDIHPGAAIIGILSFAFLMVSGVWAPLKKVPIPPSLLVVFLGVSLAMLFRRLGGDLEIEASHLVQVPEAASVGELFSFLQFPDFSKWNEPQVYRSAMIIAAVASLESLMNLEAIDKIDPLQRTSPPNRELLAQGVGNIVSGALGGLPITSVVIRSSVNVNAGSKTKLATISHGVLILLSVALMPALLNKIPLSCLAAILLATGIKLASPAVFSRMWGGGPYQFIPFIATVVAIVFTDLLIGVLIGMLVSISFILNSNFRRPLRLVREKHLGFDVLRIELSNQVSFLNRAALVRALNQVPRGGHVLIDAQYTDYMDPDVLDLIRDFRDQTAKAHGVHVSLKGFKDRYRLSDQIQFIDHSTKELQQSLSPKQVLEMLKLGHERFRTGHRLIRDLGQLVRSTASGQHPLAVVLSCIDSRTPAELIFDLAMGDILSVRIAGNISSPKVLGSVEYSCSVAGAKLILVLGHTRCGAVTAAVEGKARAHPHDHGPASDHIGYILADVQQSIDSRMLTGFDRLSPVDRERLVDEVARRNVIRTANSLVEESKSLKHLVEISQIAVVAAIYNVTSGEIEFLNEL